MKVKIYLLSLLTLLLFMQVRAQSIFTVAGNGTGGYSGDGGAALSATLNLPMGMAVDKNGNIYIADYNNNRIRKVTPAGIITTVAGNGAADYTGDGGPATGAALNNPIDVKVDDAGNLYIADYNNGLVRKVDGATGIISTFAGTQSGTAQYKDGVPATSTWLPAPYALALDNAGNVYVLSQYASTVREIVVTTGVIYGVAGDFAKADHFSGDGGPATDAAMYEPTSLAIDALGNIFIADNANGRIREVTAATGIISTFATTSASGLAVDDAGDLYITGGQQIRKITPGGTTTVIAGNGTAGTDGTFNDGPALGASLYNPRGLVLINNELYVTDANHNRVRKYRNYAALPFTESFTPDWINGSAIKDLPSLPWKNVPATGDNTWRRDDEGATANWTGAAGIPYSPIYSEQYCCWHSARFHGTTANTNGNLDLYIDLFNSNGAAQLSFNYNTTGGVNNIPVYYSSDGGLTFNQLTADSVTASGTVNWNKVFYTIHSTARNSIIRIQGHNGATPVEFGIDQLAVLPACTGTPDGGQVSPNGTNALCYGSNSSLNVYNASGGQFFGYTYQWQQSTNNGATWNPAVLNGSDALGYTTPNLKKSIQYRYNVTCSANGLSGQSDVVAFTVNAPVAAGYPYTQDFENWVNGCDVNDLPGKEWFSAIPRGIESWRRDDDGENGGWTAPESYAYTPAGSASAHSARFHSSYTDRTGSLDLHIDMSGSGGTGLLSFDYINTSGADSLYVYLSRNNGTAFPVTIAKLAANSGWATYTFPVNSTGDKTVIRFTGVGGYDFDSDMGLDNVKISNPADPAITISQSPANPFCTGATVTFTAAVAQAGATQAYQWVKNGRETGTNAPTYTDNALKNTDIVYCKLTAAGKTVQSNSLILSADKKDAVHVRVSADKGFSICAGTPVTFTAIPTNGGTAPVYQWMKNGSAVGTPGDTYTDNALQNGDQVSVQITSSQGCVISNTAVSNTYPITVTGSVPAAPSAISGPTDIYRYSFHSYSVDYVPDVLYIWHVPSGSFIEYGDHTNEIFVDWGYNSGNVSVQARNKCGAGPAVTVRVHAANNGGGGERAGSEDGAVAGTLKTTGTQPGTAVTIYPNPARSSATVAFASSAAGGEYRLELRDISGKLLNTQKGVLVKGRNIALVDVQQYTPGMYLVTIQDKANGPRTIKLVIAK